MDTTRNQSKELTNDDLDNARINKLIARYTGIHAILEEVDEESETSSTITYVINKHSRKNMVCSTKLTSSEHSSRTVQAFPLKQSDCIYNNNDTDHSPRKNDSEFNITIVCDGHDYDSVNSPLNGSDSSLLRFCHKCSKCSNAEHVALPRHRVSFQELNKSVDQQTSVTHKDTPTRKSYAEKTTYCRPIKEDRDKHLVHKLMERNAKLQLLLTKFVIARQKDKEREKWNNYVNSIKVRNRIYRDLSTHFSSPSKQRQCENLLLANDYYEGRNNLGHSDSCREILRDLYNARNDLPDESVENDHKKYVDTSTLKGSFNNLLHCFPSTPQLRKTSRQQTCNDIKRPHHRSLYGSSVVVPETNCLVKRTTKIGEKLDFNSPISTRISKVCPNQVSVIDIKQSKDAQTHITFGGYNTSVTYFKKDLQRELDTTPTIREYKVIVKDENELENLVSGKEKEESRYELHEKRESAQSISKQGPSVRDLANKLDVLVNLFNSFVADLKAKEITNKNKSIDRVVMCDIDENDTAAELQQQISASKLTKKKKKVTIVGNVMTNTSLCAIESRIMPSPDLLNTRLNKILYEELDKSNKLRSEIEAMLSPSAGRPCQVQINVDIPTRERSTEVTASLSKTKVTESQNEGVNIDEVRSPSAGHVPQARQRNTEERNYTRCRRIAVNTDPLGLLTLLNFSTEAVKQLLSLVPSMNSWCLRTFRPEPASDYVCNICGAVFRRPSQLSAHILGHDLGQTRDCCVCHHAVDSQRASQLFRCRYCGQRFTRAYCCELHQQGCARRFGLTHDIGSGLAMLR